MRKRFSGRAITAWLGILCVMVPLSHATASEASDTTQTYDILIYGGTSAAITAAIQARRSNHSVVIVCPEQHIGGLTASGLGWTDSKDAHAIGGLAREFYHRIWQYYSQPEAWTRQTRQSYHVGAQPGPGIDDQAKVMWTFEPHVAERVFEQWLKEVDVPVHRSQGLDPDKGVVVADHRIVSITTLAGRTYSARMFIDASYEGDLMAAAGVTHRIGRDSNDAFDETLNGVRFKIEGVDRYYDGRAYAGVDPFKLPGQPDSGMIAGIDGVYSPGQEPIGSADARLQSFNFRLCLTADPANRIAITKPQGYDESAFELLFRLYEAGHECGFSTQAMPNHKTDSNNSGAMSFDFVGGNFSLHEQWNYGQANEQTRQKIVQAHRDYQMGLIWTLQNHPRIPAAAREKWSRWGLAKDEFLDNGHWPYQLYVREARRMVGQMVMTEHHVKMAAGYEIDDPIGLGSYSLDSHVVRRVVVDGTIRDEGGFYIPTSTYPISYRCIVPKSDEVRNLLVPVTLSATHAAFGSIRMEPTYMILGQSAATAAALAIEHDAAVQDVDDGQLRQRLIADGQVLGR